jgi:hypothetical protein
MFERPCPTCGIARIYKTQASLEKAIRKNTRCRRCSFSGSNNPFFGKKHSPATKIAISSANLKDPERNPLTEEDIGASLERGCSRCGEIIHYASRGAYFRAEDNETLCIVCTRTGEGNSFFNKHHTDASKKAISIAHKGQRYSQATEFTTEGSRGSLNPMFGRSIYSVWLDKYGKEEADKRNSDLMVKKSEAARGTKNPMYGKPSPQGSGCGWKGWYKEWFFRSLRELAYALHLDDQGLAWKSAETKDLRIDYLDPLGMARTYAADFLVENKRLVEIKPLRLIDTPLVNAKRQAADAFCAQKGLVYEIIDPGKLEDEIITDLHDQGIIRFTERYEKMYQDRMTGAPPQPESDHTTCVEVPYTP